MSTNLYDGAGCGFDFDTYTSDSVLFWVNKTNLSQGHGSLSKPNNCTMFADTHRDNNTQLAMLDRAPDSGIVWYNATAIGAPEFDWIILPVLIMFILLIATSRKTYRRKNKSKSSSISSESGGDAA